jgi:predicted permease
VVGKVRSWSHALLRNNRFEGEMDEELRLHLDSQIEDSINAGMSPDEARRTVLLGFGGIDKTKEECRETRAFHFFDTLRQDLSYGIRIMLRNPGITAVAVLSLALAIGPNAALFSLVDSVFLRPSPVRDADEVVNISMKAERQFELIRYPDFVNLRNAARTVEGLLAYMKKAAFLSIQGERQLTSVHIVSENYFSTLGVNATLGRIFQPNDANIAGPPPVVISYGLWQRSFGADPAIIGRQILLNGRGFAVVGVAPREFRGLEWIPPEIWLPFSGLEVMVPGESQTLQSRHLGAVEVVGRLRPGISVKQAKAEFSNLVAQIAAAYPADHKAKTASVVSIRDKEKAGLFISAMVLGLVSLVLLIACANVAGVLIAQGEARRRETAIRQALGSSRGRLVRQWLTESALLGVFAAALGLLLTRWFIGLAPLLMPPIPIPVNIDVRLDLRAIGYTVTLAVITSMLFGIFPALRATKLDLVPQLKGNEAPRSGGARFFSVRGLLVIGQIAVAQLLLTGAGLFLHSYVRAQQLQPGFDAKQNMLILWLAPTFESQLQAHSCNGDELADRLRGIPGVKEVTYARSIPLNIWEGGAKVKVSIPSFERPGETEGTGTGFNRVGPQYFQTMGTRILRGRDFNQSEFAQRVKSVLVNETLARRYWRGEDPIGQFLRIENADYQIIGIVEDGKYGTIYENPMPYLFSAAPPQIARESMFLVQTAIDPKTLIGSMRRELLEAAPNLVIMSITTMEQHMRTAGLLQEAGAGLTGSIGLLGIFLASVGLYGVVSSSVTRRMHEIGVRMALGAQPRNVLALVLGQGLGFVAVGMVIGLSAAVAGAKIIAEILYGVSATDPVSFCLSALMVIVIALLATHVPLRRALNLDPIAVLRRE